MFEISCHKFETSDGLTESVYTFPFWLIEDFQSKFCYPETAIPCEVAFGQLQHIFRSVCIKLSGGRLPQITVIDQKSGLTISNAILKSVELEMKLASIWRHELLVALSKMVLQSKSVIEEDFPDESWAQQILNDPYSAEEEAIQIWNNFVDECEVPSSFLIPSRPSLSLAELIILRRSNGDRNHRQSFAENFPWAVRSIFMNSDDPKEEFNAIDENPQGSKAVAAKYICCSGDSTCEDAVSFVNRAARHRHNGELDVLLLGDQSSGDPNQIRSVLLKAYSKDSELITHIGKNGQRTGQQIEHAIKVLYAYIRNISQDGFECAHSLAGLLVRIMIRHEYEPDDSFDPEQIVTGLAAVSADSLSAFVAKQLECQINVVTDDSPLDLDVQALIDCIGETIRPRLTVNQLIKFVGQASVHSRHELIAIETFPENSWPAPPGWHHSLERFVEGATISCLIDRKSMLKEGEEMQNCLREGRYQRAALLGNLAFFSIKAEDGNATLALKPILTKDDAGRIVVTGWITHQFRAQNNSNPIFFCVVAANELREKMDSHCPFRMPEQEMERRERVQQTLDAHRFNRDTAEANARWADIYTKFLPAAFSRVEPEEIVSNYLNKL